MIATAAPWRKPPQKGAAAPAEPSYNDAVPAEHPRPDWWHWPLDCGNPHLAKRMAERAFNEAELRTMLQHATALHRQPDGRYVVRSRLNAQPWEVIVEPDPIEKVLVVVTAYPVS